MNNPSKKLDMATPMRKSKSRPRELWAMPASEGRNLDTISESPEYPAERRKCDICPKLFSSYIMQISHMQGADHKRAVEEWIAAGRPYRKCPPAPPPPFKCGLCGLDFSAEAIYDSHMKGKQHSKNVDLVRRGLEPEGHKFRVRRLSRWTRTSSSAKRRLIEDNYDAKFKKLPDWVQDAALPGQPDGCFEITRRNYTRQERARKKNRKNTLSPPGPPPGPPIRMNEFSSASSSATSPSPRPYRGEYQKSQSQSPAPPTCNNTMSKPPMYGSSSTPNPSSCFYGDEYQAPQSSWNYHVRDPYCYQRQMHADVPRWHSQPQPQNRTLGPIRYAQPPQQQQYADVNVNAVHMMQSNSSNSSNMCMPASSSAPIIQPSCNLFGNTLNANDVCLPNNAFTMGILIPIPIPGPLNNALNVMNPVNPALSMAPISSVSQSPPQCQAIAYTSCANTLNPSHVSVSFGTTMAQSGREPARTPSASSSSSSSTAKYVDTNARS